MQMLVPLLVVLISHNELLPKNLALPTYTIFDGPTVETKAPTETTPRRSYFHMGALTFSAGAVLAIYTVPSSLALGLSSAFFMAAGLVFFEAVITNATCNHDSNQHGAGSPIGLLSRPNSTSEAQEGQQLAVLRDIAAAISIVCGVAAVFLEPSVTSTAISWEPVYRSFDMDWRDVHNYRILLHFLWMIPVLVVSNALTYIIDRKSVV